MCLMSKPPLVPFETTLKVRDHCLCLAAQRAARALARRFDEVLRPLALTSGQFSLMMALNRPEPPFLGSVAGFLAMDRTTLTANLKPLERRGLILIAIDPADRRGRRLTLTQQGLILLASAVPIWQATHLQIDNLLAHDDIDVLRNGLRTLGLS